MQTGERPNITIWRQGLEIGQWWYPKFLPLCLQRVRCLYSALLSKMVIRDSRKLYSGELLEKLMQELFIAADHHFEHLNIIKRFQLRPFDDCKHMEEELIRRHNSRVRPGDRVILIGDMFWRHCKHTDEILSRLNGQKHYVLGNHEEALKWTDTDKHFVTVTESYKVDLAPYGYKEARYLFCAHFAHRVWPKSHIGTWHAYGHSHGALPDDQTAKSMDVGVDTNHYYPYSIHQFAERLKEKESTYRVTPEAIESRP